MRLKKRITPHVNVSLADIMFHAERRSELFLRLPKDERISSLSHFTRSVKKDILNHIPDADLAEILTAVDPDEATDYLQLVTKHRRERILNTLGDDFKDALSSLLEFDANTAAGLMTLDYIQVEVTDKITDVAQKFKLHERRTGRPPVILVMREGKLIGYLPGHELGFNARHQLITSMTKHLPIIPYSASHQKVIETFRANPHSKIAVINDAGSVIGIIYSDDVIKLIDEQVASTLYDFAGVNEEESVTDSVRKKVKSRYKWLLINLGTTFLAAFTISQFESIITEYVLLAVYMPIIAGMGGNAATQTLAVLVRGIALRQISLGSAWKTLKNEVGTGAINGLINGFVVAFVVLVKDHQPALALVLALAMVINLIVAAIFGTLVPLIMSKLRKDPAASATIFITTGTDVIGFLAFLGLATLILPH